MAGLKPAINMFRELNVLPSSSLKWKSISICTGASASSLQDIKVPESCGGYSYINSNTNGTNSRNRFIYWRTHQDVLELVEESLDTTLAGNMVRYRFQDTPVLPTVTFHETAGCVIILIATVASVHRLVFPHPKKLHSQHTFVVSEQNAPSIFYSAALPDDPKNQFLLGPGGSISSHFLCSSSCMTLDGHVTFTLATSSGGILVVKMPPLGVQGIVLQQELSCASVMKKLWNGIVPGAMRSSHQVSEAALSLQLMPIQDDIFIFSVCRDLRLRVWSTKTRECVLTSNLLDYTSEDAGDTLASANASGHVIKSIQGSSASDLCVYLSLQHRAQFIFLSPSLDQGRLTLTHMITLERTPPDDLVDFVVTSDILMTLWTSQSGDTMVLSTNLAPSRESPSSEWQVVELSPGRDTVMVPPSRDAREVYLEAIFSPNAFSCQVIVKALSVYRRCPAPTVELEALYSVPALKEEVVRAIDTEIRNMSQENELQEEEYTRLEQEQWEKFYSCCHQYRQVGEKSQGLFADPATGLFGVIKKATFSLLRPCDRTEELYLSPTARLPVSFIDKCGFGPEVSPAQLSDSVALLCECVQLISTHVPGDLVSLSTSCLQACHSEGALVELTQAISSSLVNEPALVRTLTTCVSKMAAPVSAVEMVYNLLEVVDDTDMDFMESGNDANTAHYSQLFAGALGSSVITLSLQQLATLRYQFARDLTVLLQIVAGMQGESGLTQKMHDTMRCELMPKGIYLLRCYQLLVWATTSLTTDNANSTLDYNLRQLSSLDIIDGSSRMARPTSGPCQVSQMFVSGVGGSVCRQRLAESSLTTGAVWGEDLGLVLNTLCHLMWPATDETVFPEFLVRSCQYLRLQEYVHILSPWCSWNESSRAFFLGLCHLHFDESHKAVSLFVSASDGLATETFLAQKLLQTEETDHYKLQILYYLKVIKLLEEKGLSDLVITMATEAINKAEEGDPNLATLQSKVFKEHLTLGHCPAAFTAMMANPDADRRKDCLRQFLVVLCEEGRLEELVGNDYLDLEPEVVHILEGRARSVDLNTHDYYSLLYSFFIYRQDFRAAGRVMLEKALRLAQEAPGLRSLQDQAQCYLAALNTLHLVKPENAWIVRPATHRPLKSHQNKRDIEGETKASPARTLEILELPDLKKEYLMLDARLRLIRHQPDTALVSGPPPSPSELLPLLCQAGLYDVGVSVLQAFQLGPEPLLSSLALRAVTLALSVSTYSTLSVKESDPSAGSWRWLRENEVPQCGAGEGSPSDQAWRLLQRYMNLLEDGSSACHKCVAQTLLAQSFHLPTWLVNSFKALDVASLLRVYLNYDMISPAASVLMEYIEAVTDVLKGVDDPNFGLKGVQPHGCVKVWLPYTCLDQVMAVLGEEEEPHYVKMYENLKDKYKTYQEKSSGLHEERMSYLGR